MKLLLCKKCSDIISLTFEPRKCICGESSAYYLKEDGDSIYEGDHAVPIGIANSSFIKAIKMSQIENKHQVEPTTCKGVDFSAFIILDCSTTIIKK